MHITKTKTYNQIPLSEFKEFLAIDESDVSQNGLLNRLLKSATSEAENYLNDDIVTTTNVIEEKSPEYAITYCDYIINFTNVSISSIQYATDFAGTGLTTINAANYTVEKHNSFARIVLKYSVSATRLVINFTSGWSSIPENVKTAIFMKGAALLDVERNGYVSTAVNNSKAFERILQPYVNNIY